MLSVGCSLIEMTASTSEVIAELVSLRFDVQGESILDRDKLLKLMGCSPNVKVARFLVKVF